MVSNRPICMASSTFVPTESVLETSTGLAYPPSWKRPPKKPTPPTTSGRRVEAASGLMSAAARSPASISTPASA